jgi:predicted dehydrogenase
MKVGIIGAGTVTSGSHLPVLVNMPGVSIEWICDKSPSMAAAVARSYKIGKTYDHVSQCSDVDAVLVATPVGARRAVVPEALARGWHVFSEKPFALTLEEHDFYLGEAKRHGVQIGVGQVRRYARSTATARKLLQRKFLGPILRVGASEGMRVRATGRGTGWYMTDTATGGGVLMETGSHLVDQVLYVLSAESAALREATQRRHLGLELASSLIADVKSGGESIECSIELSMLDDFCNGVFIEFPNYVLRVGLFFEDSLSLVSRDGITLCDIATTDGVDSPTKGFVAEWKDFLEQCRSGEPCAIDAKTVRHTTALIESCYKQAPDTVDPVTPGAR